MCRTILYYFDASIVVPSFGGLGWMGWNAWLKYAHLQKGPCNHTTTVSNRLFPIALNSYYERLPTSQPQVMTHELSDMPFNILLCN